MIRHAILLLLALLLPAAAPAWAGEGVPVTASACAKDYDAALAVAKREALESWRTAVWSMTDVDKGKLARDVITTNAQGRLSDVKMTREWAENRAYCLAITAAAGPGCEPPKRIGRDGSCVEPLPWW